jgi:hypothetical protein
MACSRRQLQQRLRLIPSDVTSTLIGSGAGLVPQIHLQTPTMQGNFAMKGQAHGFWKILSSNHDTQGCIKIYGSIGLLDAAKRFLV